MVSFAKAALLLGAVLLAAAPQPRPVAAVIAITSNPATRLVGPPPAPRGPDDNDGFGMFGDDSDDDDSDDSEIEDPRLRGAWERVWTVGTHTAAQGEPDEIDEVVVSVPGRVFLSTSLSSSPSSPTAALASVRFSGNAQRVLDAFEVVSTARNSIEVRQRAGMTSSSLSGYLLVEITLSHAQKLKRLSAKTSADVVVDSHVLVSDASSASVNVLVSGSGSVYIHDTPALNVQELALTVQGSGDIELSTTQVEAKAVQTSVGGSGEVRLFANSLRTKDLTAAVGGSGSIFVNSYNLHADSATIAIAGSGDVSVYPVGTCTNEAVVIAGSGNAYVGSIACERATVKIGGSGDAFVQASQAIDGGVVGSGDVEYVGAAPASIAPQSSFFQSKKKEPKPMAKAASHNKFKEARTHNLPERVPVRLSVYAASFSSRAALVPLVLLALLAVWYIRHENKKQRSARSAEELQPLAASGQAQVYV